jgi:hypothetical protein
MRRLIPIRGLLLLRLAESQRIPVSQSPIKRTLGVGFMAMIHRPESDIFASHLRDITHCHTIIPPAEEEEGTDVGSAIF